MTNEKTKSDAQTAEQDGRYYGVAAEFDYAIRAAREAAKRVAR